MEHFSGASEQKISSKVNNFDVPKEYRALYGEGNAANMIIDILKKCLKKL